MQIIGTRNRVVREMPVIPRAMTHLVMQNKPIEVAYCRVSTEDESQEDSYKNQIDHYTAKIKANDSVEFGGIYADYALSGTHAESRPEFQRMMMDARLGKINRIRCKALQRFGRNTVDVLSAVRELREIRVEVIFEQQNINTLDATGDIMMTIMAALSEQESRNISENVKFGYREKFRQGEVQVNWARWLGYMRNEETGELEIIEEEAEIIRRIYREFLSGYSTHQIANGLTRDRIKTADWKKPKEKHLEKLKQKESIWLTMSEEQRIKQPLYKWYARTVMNILINEKYSGDSISGKTFKVDVLSKKRKINNGEAPKFNNQNTHDAIISKETFDMVQEEISRRNGLRGATNTGRAKHSSKYILSKMIECGCDGQTWRRYAYYNKNGEHVPVWICQLKKVPKGSPYKCNQHWIKEQSFIDAYMEILRELSIDQVFINALTENIVTSIDENAPKKLAEIEDNVDIISRQILDVVKCGINNENGRQKLNELISKQEKLTSERLLIKEQIAEHNLSANRVDELREVINQMQLDTKFNEQGFKAIVEKIIVKDNIATFKFHCGIEIQKHIE